jgi:hypothetical protein
MNNIMHINIDTIYNDNHYYPFIIHNKITYNKYYSIDHKDVSSIQHLSSLS